MGHTYLNRLATKISIRNEQTLMAMKRIFKCIIEAFEPRKGIVVKKRSIVMMKRATRIHSETDLLILDGLPLACIQDARTPHLVTIQALHNIRPFIHVRILGLLQSSL